MTLNGISLKRKLPTLVEVGLTNLNISLDTLDPLKYELVTRRRGFDAVMEALRVAKGLQRQGLQTKINCVVIRGAQGDPFVAVATATLIVEVQDSMLLKHLFSSLRNQDFKKAGEMGSQLTDQIAPHAFRR